MTPVLFDADAFLCARRLKLLEAILRTAHAGLQFYMTEYVARQELSTVSREVDDLCARGVLVIQAVPAQRVMKLRREDHGKKRGLDKGEAEAIAWAMELPANQRPLFISNDLGAREGAQRNRVHAGDLMDFLIEAILAGALSRDEARQLVAVWDDKAQQQCRPRDWDGFDRTFARRQAQRP